MKKRPYLLLLALIPWLWSGGAAFAAAPSSTAMTVTTAASSYSTGATVDVTGSTGGSANVQVALQVSGPGGNNVFVDQVTSDAQGSFSDSFVLRDAASAGTYTVFATTAGESASATFLVTGGQALTLSTDQASYHPGDTVAISGSSSAGAAANGSAVALEVDNPAGSPVFVDTVTAAQDGSFSDSFALSASATTGQYTVRASADVAGTVEGGSATFTVASPSSGGSGGGSGGCGGGTGGGGGAGSGGSGGGAVLQEQVGSQGGTFTANGGNLTLDVPPGTFPSGTQLTVTENASTPTPPPGDVHGATPVYQFDFGGVQPQHPIAVTFTLDTSVVGTLPSTRIGLFYQDAWQWVKSTVDLSAGKVNAEIGQAGNYAVFVNQTTFNDVPQGYWARRATDLLLGRDAISGFPDGGFHPDGTVTRTQFVKMLVLALGLPLPQSPASEGFTDVSAGAWYAPYVDAAVSAKLVEGVTPQRFAPDALITRAQLAVMIARAMNGYAPTSPLTVQFTDKAQIPSWALSGVIQAAQAGIIHGLSSGAFDPSGDATRAQAAQLVANLVTVTNQ